MSKKKELLRAALRDIAGQFNYVEIAEYYKSVDWKLFGGIGGKDKTPSAKNLFDMVIERLDRLVDEKLVSCGSGGLTILKATGHLIISFHCFRQYQTVYRAQIHDELSDLAAVQEYFDYISHRRKKR